MRVKKSMNSSSRGSGSKYCIYSNTPKSTYTSKIVTVRSNFYTTNPNREDKEDGEVDQKAKGEYW